MVICLGWGKRQIANVWPIKLPRRNVIMARLIKSHRKYGQVWKDNGWNSAYYSCCGNDEGEYIKIHYEPEGLFLLVSYTVKKFVFLLLFLCCLSLMPFLFRFLRSFQYIQDFRCYALVLFYYQYYLLLKSLKWRMQTITKT